MISSLIEVGGGVGDLGIEKKQPQVGTLGVRDAFFFFEPKFPIGIGEMILIFTCCLYKKTLSIHLLLIENLGVLEESKINVLFFFHLS